MPELLRLDLPPNLPKLLGYRGRERYFQIYWEPDCGLVSVDKKENLYVATDLAFHLFSLKFSFDLGFTYLFNIKAAMLFDRRTKCLYGGARETIAQILEEPNCLRLIEPADLRKKPNYVFKVKEFAGFYKSSIKLATKVTIITFLVGVTALVGTKIFWGIMDTDAARHTLKKDVEQQKDQSLLPSEYK